MGYTYFTIKDIAEMIRTRQRMKKDATICIVGFKGQGKSTCGWRLAKRLGKYQVEMNGEVHDTKRFYAPRDMMYSRQDVIDFILNRKFSVSLVDELINVAYNREFAQTDQQAIVKALNQFRSPHYNVYIMCNPFFYDLDPDFRNMFWMRIDVITRGVALVHTVNESIYGNDPWETNYNKKVEEKWKNTKGNSRPRYRELTTFRGILLYGKLSDKAERVYERIRNEKRGLASKYLNEMKGKVEKVADGIYESLIAGKLNKEMFNEMLKISNLNVSNTRSYINKKIKEKYPNKYINDFLVVPKKEPKPTFRFKI